jgi:hypothetical protein
MRRTSGGPDRPAAGGGLKFSPTLNAFPLACTLQKLPFGISVSQVTEVFRHHIVPVGVHEFDVPVIVGFAGHHPSYAYAVKGQVVEGLVRQIAAGDSLEVKAGDRHFLILRYHRRDQG